MGHPYVLPLGMGIDVLPFCKKISYGVLYGEKAENGSLEEWRHLSLYRGSDYIMNTRLLVIIPFLLLSMACFTFEGLAYRESLTDEYTVWTVESWEWTSIVERKTDGSLGPDLVGPMVFAYGWNEDFIIAKQHPNPKLKLRGTNTEITNWFIIEIATKNVHGPLTEEEFKELRQELGIPAWLIFTKTIET